MKLKYVVIPVLVVNLKDCLGQTYSWHYLDPGAVEPCALHRIVSIRKEAYAVNSVYCLDRHMLYVLSCS